MLVIDFLLITVYSMLKYKPSSVMPHPEISKVIVGLFDNGSIDDGKQIGPTKSIKNEHYFAVWEIRFGSRSSVINIYH